MFRINKTRIKALILVLLLSAINLNSSQAACLKANQETHQLSEKECYHFLANLEDYQIKAIYDSVESKNTKLKVIEYRLDAYINPSINQVEISGVEPVKMQDFLDNTMNFEIDYSIQAINESNNNLKRDMNEIFMQDSTIQLNQSEQEPYWRLSNQNGTWGIGVPDIGIPKAIRDIIPKKLEDINVTYSFKNEETDTYHGTITIMAPDSKKYEGFNLKLSDLKLSNQLNQQITENQVKNSNLEIIKNYDFIIPCMNDTLTIKGTVTFAIYIDVTHDVK